MYCSINTELTLKKTGKRIAYLEVHRFTVKDGKIVDVRIWEDTSLVRDSYSL